MSTTAIVQTRNEKVALSVIEMAEWLGISPSTAWRLQKSGEIRSFKIRDCVRISVAEIADFMRRSEDATMNKGETK